MYKKISLEECVGKTIQDIKFHNLDEILFITFTDKTFLILEPSGRYYDDSPSIEDGDPCYSRLDTLMNNFNKEFLLNLKIIDQDDVNKYEKIQENNKISNEATQKALRKRQFEELKKEFGNDN